MRFCRTIELEEIDDSDVEALEIAACTGEDCIQLKFEEYGFTETKAILTTRQALQLINDIRAAIDECELEQFIEVNHE